MKGIKRVECKMSGAVESQITMAIVWINQGLRRDSGGMSDESLREEGGRER